MSNSYKNFVNFNKSEGTLAIVESSISEDFKVKVRIPAYHGPHENPDDGSIWVDNSELPEALIVVPINSYRSDIKLYEGDIVYVTFSNDDIRYPVITGWSGGPRAYGSGNVTVEESYYTGSEDEGDGSGKGSNTKEGNYYTKLSTSKYPAPSNRSGVFEYEPLAKVWSTPTQAIGVFGYRGAVSGTSHTGSNFHNGVDLSTSGGGYPLYAVADGVVDTIMHVKSHGSNQIYIRVKGSDGKEYVVEYHHLDAVYDKYCCGTYKDNGFSEYVYKGSRVRAGQLIGYVGSTGNSSGPHLHISVRDSSKWYDPGRKLGMSSCVSKKCSEKSL